MEGRVAAALAEYRRVLLRPQIAERHGLEDDDVDALLAALTMPAYLRQAEPDADIDPCDPPPETPAGDEHGLRLLAREPLSALISGDVALMSAIRGWREALTPTEAVAEALKPG